MNSDLSKSKINFEVSGEGHNLVLLHGFMEDLTMWDAFVPMLSSKCRVIRIDLLGHGKTPCFDEIHGMELMAEAVHQVLCSLKIEAVSIVGHSMGGYVALALADEHPNLVTDLVLLNSTFQADSEERVNLREKAIEQALESKAAYRKLIRMSFTNLFAPESRARFPEEFNSALDVALKMPLCGYTGALKGMKIRPDRLKVLESINGKKIVIAGRKDGLIDLDVLRETSKTSSIEVIEYSEGHMSHIENKSDLSYFLNRLIEK